MEKIDAFAYGEQILNTLTKGAFLNVAAEGKQNTMTIGWGALGFQWGLPTFTVMVRQSRYTKTLLDKNQVFTVSVPVKEGLKRLSASAEQNLAAISTNMRLLVWKLLLPRR